jgi:hypothetical protein
MNKCEMEQLILQVCSQVTMDQFHTFILSMPRQMQAIIEAHGAHL